MLCTASCKGQNGLWVAPLTTEHKMESYGAQGKMIFFLFEFAERGLVTLNGSWGFPGSVLGAQNGPSSLFLYLWTWSREATHFFTFNFLSLLNPICSSPNPSLKKGRVWEGFPHFRGISTES